MKSRRFHLIIALLLLMSGVIAALLQSRAVLQWSWQKVEGMTHGVVSARQIDGVLAGPITIEGLRIRVPSTEIDISSARFDWHPGRLLGGRLSIIEARAPEVTVTLRPDQSETAKPRSDGISAPLSMMAGLLAVDHLLIRYEGHKDIAIDNIVVEGADWRGDRLWVDRIAANSPWGSLNARGFFATRTGTEIDLQTSFRPNPAWIADPIELAGKITGTLGHPQFSQHISGAARGVINGDIDWVARPLHWQAIADIEPFSLKGVRAAWRPLMVGGHLEGKGNFLLNELSGNFTLTDRTLGNWSGTAALKQDRARIEISQVQLHGTGHAAQIDGHGKLTLSAAPDYVIDADLHLSWRDLVWPVAGQNEKVRSHEGSADLSGSLRNYHLTTDLALAMPHYPPTRWQLEGTGDLKHFASPSVQLQGLDGKASGVATITWSPHLEWQAHLVGKGLNPGNHWKQWPGRLDIDISSDGKWQQARSMNINVHAMRGSLRGYPLNGQGRIDYLNGLWKVASLQLASGSTKFTAAGSITAPWDVAWQLDAPQLSKLVPQALGKVHAKGTIRGNGKEPRIMLDAVATQLQWEKVGLRGASLFADIDLAAQHPWQLQLRAEDMNSGDTTLLNLLDIQGSGSAASHQFALQLERGDGRFSLAADGAYLNGTWRGELRDGSWSERGSGTLQQESPAAFAVSSSLQSLTPFCWHGEEARGCVDYLPVESGGSELHIALSALPVPLLAEWLPRQDVKLAGKIFADATARIDDGLQEATLNAHVEGGALRYQHPLGSTIDLQFNKFALMMMSKGGSSVAEADVMLSNGDTLHLQGHLPRWSVGAPLGGEQPVEGAAALAMRDLAWMTLVVPEILEPKGTINANLALGGNVADPRLTGTLALENGSVSIPRAGLSLRKIALMASSPDGISLRIAGAATSGPGWVTLEGNVHGETLNQWRSDFILRGDRFEAVRLPSVHLLASPEIRATIEPRKIDVVGTLRVPEADIHLPEFPTTVAKSPDVVVVNGDEAVAQAARWKINSRLTMQLGDYIRLEGYGFKGRIDGALTVTEKPDSLATGQGELTVHDGRYRAYGQDLTIDYGRLLFANSPLDNPALDVRASRSKNEITVGVDITGRLQRPELRLFSQPPMEESDALAYLVLGHPLRTATSSEATNVTAAATSLGLVGGERIAQAVGNEFGVDEVSVGSEYAQDAALLLGKYLSPRLYLQYAVVFSDAINVTRLRYELTNHWYIKAESGEQQAVDILYTFER